MEGLVSKRPRTGKTYVITSTDRLQRFANCIRARQLHACMHISHRVYATVLHAEQFHYGILCITNSSMISI